MNSDTFTFIYNQREGMPFFINRDSKACDLFIKDMKEIMTGAIGGIASPWKTGAAKGPLSNLSILCPGEQGAPVFHFNNSLNSLPTHDLNSVLVRKIVASFNGIKRVIFPGVICGGRDIVKSGIDPALSGDGVGAERVNLREDGDVSAGLLSFDGRPQPSESPAND
jgi:hypothetical protein